MQQPHCMVIESTLPDEGTLDDYRRSRAATVRRPRRRSRIFALRLLSLPAGELRRSEDDQDGSEMRRPPAPAESPGRGRPDFAEAA
jgi:hypothetical protein